MHSHLTRSKIAKNNEFYTQYADVATEIEHYLQATPELFRDKCVYLPVDCALYAHSAFYRYFKANFTRFGLRKLIAVGYNALTDECGAKRGFCYTLETSWTTTTRIFTEQARALEGDGDFRSEECCPFWQEADFIITNPPFSLLSHFIELLVAYNKRYLFVGSYLTMAHKLPFQQIFLGKMWFGAERISKFLTPQGALRTINCQWYTNLYHEVPNNPLPTLRTMAENKALYSSRKDAPKGASTKLEVGSNNRSNFKLSTYAKSAAPTLYKPYDNYEAIEVPRIEYIPSDYYGRMGVPITILPYIIHPQNKYEVRAGETSANTQNVESADTSNFQLSNLSEEREAPPAARALNLAEVSEFGYVHSRAVRINDKRNRQYRGAVIDGKMCFSRIIIQHIDSLQEEANQKSKIKNQKSNTNSREVEQSQRIREVVAQSPICTRGELHSRPELSQNSAHFRILGKLANYNH